MPANMTIAWGSHTQLRVVLVTLLGQDHYTALAMRGINTKLLEREKELEEYNPCDQGLKAHLPTPITCWVHIWLSDWFAQQLDGGGGLPIPDCDLVKYGSTVVMGGHLPPGI